MSEDRRPDLATEAFVTHRNLLYEHASSNAARCPSFAVCVQWCSAKSRMKVPVVSGSSIIGV